MEVGRAEVVVDYNDNKVKAGLAGTKSDLVGLEAAGQGVGQRILAGMAQGFKGNWKDVGKNVAGEVTNAITAPLGSMGGVASAAAAALGPVGIAGLAVAAGVTAVGVASVKAAGEWDAGMARVSKTTGIEKGTQAYSDLNNQLKDIYATMPVAKQEILNVATAAGSLGIEKQSIAGFTQTAIMMGSAFDLPAEEAAVAMGKIKSQMKTLPAEAQDSASFAQHMGSAIDMMGNEYNATEKDILDFSTRVSGSMSTLGAGAYETAAWGGMLSSVFPSAERAAGSFDALLTQLTTNEESQATAAQLLGVSTEEFMAAMSTDPSDTLLRIGRALEGLPADQVLATTKALGGAYGMDSLVKMVGHTEEYAKAIDKANKAGKEGTSIGTSYKNGINNMQDQTRILVNELSALAIDIGTPIASALTPAISGIAAGLNQIRTAGEAAWGPITTGVQRAGSAIQSVQGFLSAFASDLKNIITQSSAFQALASALEPVRAGFEAAVDVVGKFGEALTIAIPKAAEALGKVGQLGINKGADFLEGLGFKNLADYIRQDEAEVAEAVEDATKKGMEEGVKGAKPTIASEVSQALDEAFWSAAVSRQRAGVTQLQAYSWEQKILETGGPVQTGTGKSSWKSSGFTITAQEANTTLKMQYTPSSTGGKYALRATYPDGKTRDLASYSVSWGNTPSMDQVVENLLNQAQMDVSPATFNTLANKLQLQATVQEISLGGILWDTGAGYTAAIKDVGQAINEAINSNWFDSETIGNLAARLQQAKEQIESIEFKTPDMENSLIGIQAALDALAKYQDLKLKLQAEPDNERLQMEVRQAWSNAQATLQGLGPVTLEITAELAFDAQVLAAELAGNTKKLADLGISDLARYRKYAQGALRDDLKSYLEKGLAPTPGTQIWQDLYDEYTVAVDNWGKLDAYNKEVFWQMGEALHGGGAEWKDVYSLLGGGSLGSMGSVATDQAQVSQALDKTAESMNTWCEAASEFAYWQETAGASQGMFNKSFIGSTEAYNKFMESGEAARRQTTSPYAVNVDTSKATSEVERLDQELQKERQMPFQIEGMEAAMQQAARLHEALSQTAHKSVIVQEVSTGADSEENEGGAGWPTYLPTQPTLWPAASLVYQADTSKVSAELQRLDQEIQKGRTLPLQISGMDEAMLQAATAQEAFSQPATKTISILEEPVPTGPAQPSTYSLQADTSRATAEIQRLDQELTKERKMPFSIQGIEAAMQQAARLHEALSQTAYKTVVIQEVYGGSSGYAGSNYTVQSPGGGSFDYTPSLPRLGTGGYVPSPTMAVVGDRPGGEIVAGLDQLQGLIKVEGGNGGVNVQVNVYGDVTGEELVEHIKEQAIKEVAYQLNRGGTP